MFQTDEQKLAFLRGKNPKEVAWILDGDDYGRGAIEALQATDENIKTFLSKLILHLIEKGMFSEDEILGMLSGLS